MSDPIIWLTKRRIQHAVETNKGPDKRGFPKVLINVASLAHLCRLAEIGYQKENSHE